MMYDKNIHHKHDYTIQQKIKTVKFLFFVVIILLYCYYPINSENTTPVLVPIKSANINSAVLTGLI